MVLGSVGRRAFTRGAVVGGGLGADAVGSLGTELRVVSGSEVYDESRSAPVSIPPPLFFNLGIPPAKMLPSCGASEIPFVPEPPRPSSLLLRARFTTPCPGTGGAVAPGGFNNPGTAGALATGAFETPPPSLPIRGADRSFVTAFLSFAPLVISVNSAPWHET